MPLFDSFFKGSDPKAAPQTSDQAFAMAMAAMYQLDAAKDLAEMKPRYNAVPNPEKLKAEVLEKFCRLDMGEKGKTRARQALAGPWNIKSPDDLGEVLSELLTVGHRTGYNEWTYFIKHFGVTGTNMGDERLKQYLINPETGFDSTPALAFVLSTKDELGPGTIAGWDFARYSNLLRLGYVAGYITAEQGWTLSNEVVPLARKELKSWTEFGNGFIIGRKFWQRGGNDDAVTAVVRELMENPCSPWQVLSW